jgi:hypothetical protein
MALEVEHLHDSIPYRLALKYLFDGDALDIGSLRPVQFENDASQLFNVGHWI